MGKFLRWCKFVIQSPMFLMLGINAGYQSGGGGSSASSSWSPEQRQQMFQQTLRSIFGDSASQEALQGMPQYHESQIQQLNGGDYEGLRNSMVSAATAPLAQQEKLWREQSDQDAANRGIWSSGLALRNQNDVTDKLGDAYATAGANATTASYNLQAQDQNNANQLRLQNASNTFNGQWQPLNYLAQLWGGANGQSSYGQQGGSSGFNFGVM